MDTLDSVYLLTQNAEDFTEFLGTCFAFRQKNQFLTAAHCVNGKAPQDLSVLWPRTGNTYAIASVETHPSADIAVLKAADRLPINTRCFPDLVSRNEVGTDFTAFGFPEDVLGPNRGEPVARLFKGHFQRFFQYKSPMGFSYAAGEMSVGCPAGLSGGPVFDTEDPMHRVHGVVTENFESTTVLESVEETERAGSVTRQSYRKVICFGLCVVLSDLHPWLSTHAPRPSA